MTEPLKTLNDIYAILYTILKQFGNLNVQKLITNEVTVENEVTVAEDSKGTVLYDDGAGIFYCCKAPIGTALSAAAWQIQKIDTTVTDTAVKVLWCDGDALYNNTATSLAVVQGHSYS